MKKIPVKKKDSKSKSRPEDEFNRLSEGKTINVSDLPTCSHKKFLLSVVQDPKRSKICVVAFLNHDRKWEAFAGYPDVRDLKTVLPEGAKTAHPYDVLWLCENVNDVMSVTMMGQKIEPSAALKLFPDWSVMSYFE